MMKLYDSALSGNCHKVRMMLGFLKLPYEKIDMNWARGDHKREDYRAINPRAQLPTIDDDGMIVWDSQAILFYLSRTYGDSSWCPMEVKAFTRVMQFLMLANEEISALAWARVTVLMKQPRERLNELQSKGRAGLAVLEDRLKNHSWVALDHVTIADIACFPYVGMAEQGEVSLDECPSVRTWIARVKSLPNYTAMPGLD